MVGSAFALNGIAQEEASIEDCVVLIDVQSDDAIVHNKEGDTVFTEDKVI